MRTAIDLEAPGRIEVLREDFDRIAAAGRDAADDHSTRFVAELLARVPAPLDRALDLGCGAGDLLVRLATRARYVTGVDLSPGMLERARARTAGRAVELVLGDILATPLPPASFDLVCSVATFHHLPLDRALARAAELVRPGGTLLVVDLFRPVGLGGFLYDVRWWLHARRHARAHAPARAVRDAWRAHEAHDRMPAFAEVRRAAAPLAGADLRMRPLWRWTLLWTRPV